MLEKVSVSRTTFSTSAYRETTYCPLGSRWIRSLVAERLVEGVGALDHFRRGPLEAGERIRRDVRHHGDHSAAEYPRGASWLESGRCEVVPIVWDVLSAIAARESGADVVYLAGGAVSVTSALPDLGLLSVERMVGLASDIAARAGTSLVVDADSGFGGAPVLVQLCETLARTGAVGIVLGDDEAPGHMSSRPGTLDQGAMARRLELARRASEGALRIVARMSLEPEEPLESALRRIRPYVEAGADGVMVRGARSREELWEIAAATREAGGAAVGVVFRPPATGYFATPEAAQEAGFAAIIVGAPQYAVYPHLRTLYDATMRGDVWCEHVTGVIRRTMERHPRRPANLQARDAWLVRGARLADRTASRGRRAAGHRGFRVDRRPELTVRARWRTLPLRAERSSRVCESSITAPYPQHVRRAEVDPNERRRGALLEGPLTDLNRRVKAG